MSQDASKDNPKAEKEKPKAEKTVKSEEQDKTSVPVSLLAVLKAKKMVIIIAAVVSLSVASTIIALQFTDSSAGSVKTKEQSTEQSEPEKAEEKPPEKAEEKSAEKPLQAENISSTNPALFLAIDPSFTVNIAGGNRLRIMQVKVQLMARNQKILDIATSNLPIIQNNLVQLFSSKSYDELITPEGKEMLRQEALRTVQKIIMKEIGQPGIEDILFTSFVMQ